PPYPDTLIYLELRRLIIRRIHADHADVVALTRQGSTQDLGHRADSPVKTRRILSADETNSHAGQTFADIRDNERGYRSNCSSLAQSDRSSPGCTGQDRFPVTSGSRGRTVAREPPARSVYASLASRTTKPR